MRRAAVLVLAVLAPAVAPATAATPPARLALEVTQPAKEVVAGERMIVRVTVRNRSLYRAGRGAFTLVLAGGPTPSQVPRRIDRFKTHRLEPDRFRRFTIGFRLARATPEGSYRLRTCLTSFGRKGRRCRVSHRFAVSAPGEQPQAR